MKITLKDGIVKEYDDGSSIADIAKDLGMGLYKSSCAGTIDGKLSDLRTSIDKDGTVSILTFREEEGKKAFWHTAAHMLAQAVKRIVPDAKLAIGPAIDNGFYYDFDCSTSFTPELLEKIQAEMKKIAKEDIAIERFTLPFDEAMALAEKDGEQYKAELISDLKDKGEEISFYKQGEFTDLCAGPHLMSTGAVKAIKLTQSTGAYWRGDAKNKMLQRIYGVAFPKASELEVHLEMVEEAKKRDHNKIGRDLEYFTTVDIVGQGLPIMMPKGAKVIQLLERFVEDVEESRGYLLTKTPFMAKSDLYKISGHWDHYRDGMFVMGDEEKDDEVYALRPMTCPFQFQVYLSKMRSYKELPMRLNETSTLFRNESSGEMHGLIRVRQFTLAEGHIACRPDQLEQEFKDSIDLANYMLKTLGLDGDVSYRFSKWDKENKDKYIGDAGEWERVQDLMRNILDKVGLDYVEADGEAAFYGPKLDIQIKNVHGKEDTLITVQIDFQLADRFNMEYVDADGSKKHPYVIHRSSIGCYERTLALLLEKYAGALPTWLSPTQVKILPIGDRQHEFAENVLSKLREKGIRTEIDERNEKIGYKIREAQLDKTPYMLVIGDKEVEANAVAVRGRKAGDLGAMGVDEFIAVITKEIDSKDTGLEKIENK